ncbi:MAG TPA: hypothetical protein VH369_19800 [Bryobacteraceae bacterium]|jgi:hypothetical protein
MLPLTLLAARKLAGLLTTNDLLTQTITSLAQEAGITISVISSDQVVISSAARELGDREIEFNYPRVCVYSSQINNTQEEKFRSFSGGIVVAADIWASGNLLDDSDQWIHYYVEALTAILRANRGDWGDGFLFSGIYDVQLQPPKIGGFGYVELARVTCGLNVSLV